METLRTPEELNNPEFNYYLAYAIDPAVKDTEKIKAAMAQVKNTFAQGTPVQRRLKELYAEAVKIMTDNVLREEEFQSAKKIKLETVEKLITAIFKSRGVIYKSDFIKISGASGKWLTAEEIEKNITCRLRQDVKLIDDTKRSLDLLTYNNIEKHLKTTGKSDLYDLFGMSQGEFAGTLQSAVASAYKAVAGKTDPKSIATSCICRDAKRIFEDENSKKFYDIYLATRDIWAEFALRRSCGITEMESKEFFYYYRTAKEALKTSDSDYVKQLLLEGLYFFRINLVGGDFKEIKLWDDPPTPFMERCTKSYGLPVLDNGIEKVVNIIFKGTVKPVHEEREFGTSSADQRAINLRVYENDSTEECVNLDECVQLFKSCEIKLTPGLPENAPVNIIFYLDDDGVLNISAFDLTNNIDLRVTTVRIVEGEEVVRMRLPGKRDNNKNTVRAEI